MKDFKTNKILLLGSGELGKEFAIAAKRLGQIVIAVDSYNDAPAQQVSDFREVINMLDGNELDRIVEKEMNSTELLKNINQISSFRKLKLLELKNFMTMKQLV